MPEQIILKKCSQCKDFKPRLEFYKDNRTKDGHCSECKTCHCEKTNQYAKTKKGKATHKRYMQSKKGKVVKKRYEQSEKCRVAKRRYNKSKKGKIAAKRHKQTNKGRITQKRYQQTEKGKVTKKRYQQSEKGKAAHKRYSQSEKFKIQQKRYHQSEKGKAVIIQGVKRFRIRYPEKYKAEKAVNNAIAVGKLPKANTLQCHYCPAQAEQYHHHKGYAQEYWLDVIAVCVKCHSKLHLNQ